ncbi:alpha/beta hydrolase [Leucobacter exalbidus]|nr:alpha/beta hydrolase [Leucobacter exalbidus]
MRGEIRNQTREQVRPQRRKAGWAVVAAVAAAALALSGCSALSALVPGNGSAEVQSNGGAPQELPEKPAGSVVGMGEQSPNWRDCAEGLQCADVYAPLNWGDPAGELITLRIVKHEATGSDPIGTLFVNPGGPGASGVDYVTNALDYAIPSEVQREYDVIGWDPRGVGSSSPITCLDAAGMDEYLFGLGDGENLEPGSADWITEVRAESRQFGADCQNSTGDLLGHVSTDDTVQDLDMLRAIVGDEQLNYLGFSYGTYIGARYADAYPQNVGRLVLDGAMDPASTMSDVVREQTRGFELALRAYVTNCLTQSDCPLSGTVDEAMQQISVLLDEADTQPLQGKDGRWLSANTLLTAIITPLYAESNWGMLDQLFAAVLQGNPEVGLALADLYYDREGGAYLSNSTEAFSAINCLDYPERAVDVQQMRAEAAQLTEIAPTIGRFQGYGALSCAEWPVDSSSDRGPVTATGAAPILVVGTTGDPATPYRWAESLAEQLDSGVLLTYEGEGHTAYGESNCIDEVINAYLLTGEAPAKPVTCSR